MNKPQRGFTLVELMVVVSIIGILASIAMGTFQDYTIRAKVTEGLELAKPAKNVVAEGFYADGLAIGVLAASTAWNFVPTKYVSNVAIAPTGVITVTFGPVPAEILGQTLVLTPSIAKLALCDGAACLGNMDWACGSATTVTATTRGVPVTVGSLPTRYAPAECR